MSATPDARRVKARNIRVDDEVFVNGRWRSITGYVRDGGEVWLRCGFDLMSVRTRPRTKFLTRARAESLTPQIAKSTKES